MKKLLNKLIAFTVISSSSSFIVACEDKKLDSKKDILKSANKPSDLSETLTKVKNYIDERLHHVGTQSFDEYVALYPDRQFFTNQYYQNVVDVVNKYIKLFCKKESLDFVKVELNEQNTALDERHNVVKIKLVLNEQSFETTITLKNVKKANIEGQKANLLATKLKMQTHNLTYLDFNNAVSVTAKNIVDKINQIYRDDLVIGHFDGIALNASKMLPSFKLKWEENTIPLIVTYNRKPTEIDLKVTLINAKQFPEYEVNRIINEFLIKEEDSFEINPNIRKNELNSSNYYYDLVSRINTFLTEKSTLVQVKLSDSQDKFAIDHSSLIKVKIDVYYFDKYSKEIELKIN